MKGIIALLAASLCAVAAHGEIDPSECKLANSNWGGTGEAGVKVNTNGYLEATAPEAGEVVQLQHKFYSSWLKKSDAERRADLENAEFRKEMKSCGSLPRPVRLAWLGGDGESRVVVERASDGKVFFDKRVRGNDCIVENLEANCEYKWTCYSLGLKTSSTFRTADAFPRQLHWEGVKNVRDLGGRVGLGGRRIKQGLVFRSAGFEDCREVEVKDASGKVVNYVYPIGKRIITPKGVLTATGLCGVKTDLDLRWNEECEGLDGSALGPNVRRIHIPFYAYGRLGSKRGRDAFKQAFAVFLDEANYPIDFHCIAGADRTGSLAFVLNALLGVSMDELVRDWEVTAFSSKMPDFTHATRFDKLLTVFDNYAGETIREKVEAFVKDCGFTAADIEKFRGIMVE